MVQGEHRSDVALRGCTEKRLVGEVPRGILETPAAEALVLAAVAEPAGGGGHVDARACAAHELEVAVLEWHSVGVLGGSGRAEPVVLGVGEVHEPRCRGGRDRLPECCELRDRVGVIDHHDPVAVADRIDAEVAAARQVEDRLVGIDGHDVHTGDVRSVPVDDRVECGEPGGLSPPGDDHGQRQHQTSVSELCARPDRA